MKHKLTLIITMTLFLISTAVFAAQKPEITVYKSASCGCCKKWVAHLEQNGFKVNAHNVSDVTPYKIKNGVPQTMTSCHTALVNGYVIEGHVPAKDIVRLLNEKPKVKGLTVPGMPVGTPGMEMGSRKDRYNVMSFDENGKSKVYSSY